MVYKNTFVKFDKKKLMLQSRVPLTYRAPLPSLPPLETEIDALVPLVTKCLNTTSPKEKNDLIMEITALWKQQRAELMKMKRENIEKNAILTQITHKMDKRKEELNKLYQETEFYRKPQALKAKKPLKSFIDSIKEAEALRAKHQPVSKPYLLDQLMGDQNLSDDDKLYKLYDLLFQRWEETAYTYNNRLNKFQDSIETQFEIKDEFGGSSGLYQKYLELVEENKKMLNEEAEIMNDAFIKRRKSKEFNHLALRSLISIYQEIINKENAALSSFAKFDFDARPEQVTLNFDSLLNDTAFTSNNLSFEEQSINEGSELRSNESNTKEEQLSVLKQLIEEELNVQKELQHEIDNVEVPVYQKEGPQRYQKIVEDNTKYNQKLLEIKNQIEQNINEFNQNYQKLRDVIMDKFKSENSIALQTYELNNLIREHSLLMPQFYRNKKNNNSLSTLSMSFCETLIEEPDYAYNYLKDQLDALAKEREAINAAANSQILEHEIKEPPKIDEPVVPFSSGHIKLHFRRKLRKSSTLTNTKSLQEERIPSLEPIYFTKTELKCALSTIAELGDFTQQRKKIHDIAQISLSNIHDSTSNEIKQFERFFFTNLGQTKLLSNSILIKEKAEIGIQSTAEVEEIEIQTEDPEPPRKGGKKNTTNKKKK